MSQQPADRIRTLLLRADNVLKNEGEANSRVDRARKALEEAREVARDPAVDVRLRDLIERRLAGIDELGWGSTPSSGSPDWPRGRCS